MRLLHDQRPEHFRWMHVALELVRAGLGDRKRYAFARSRLRELRGDRLAAGVLHAEHMPIMDGCAFILDRHRCLLTGLDRERCARELIIGGRLGQAARACLRAGLRARLRDDNKRSRHLRWMDITVEVIRAGLGDRKADSGCLARIRYLGHDWLAAVVGDIEHVPVV